MHAKSNLYIQNTILFNRLLQLLTPKLEQVGLPGLRDLTQAIYSVRARKAAEATEVG